jgi:GT2 family glycosyltransferase
MNDMHVSIAIVSWNTAELLAKCLESIYLHPPEGKFEVLVVDNASTDHSRDIVRERFPQVKLLENENNVGFSVANNQAIRQSHGEYIILLNPDTEVKAGGLNRLIAFMAAHPRVGGAGPRLLNPDGSLQTSCYPEPTLGREFWRLFHLDRIRTWGVYKMDSWDLEDPRDVEVIQGACLALRSAALDEVGLLDEGYFMYTEEVDLCHRLRKAGWALSWVPQAEVIHYGGQSTRQLPSEMFIHLYRSKIQFFRKNRGRLASWIYKTILFSSALSRLMVSPFTRWEDPVKRDRYRTLARHYRRLVSALPRL